MGLDLNYFTAEHFLDCLSSNLLGTLDGDPATFLDVEFGKGKGCGHGKEEGPARSQKKAGNTLPSVFGCDISISHWSPGIGDQVCSMPVL